MGFPDEPQSESVTCEEPPTHQMAKHDEATVGQYRAPRKTKVPERFADYVLNR